MELLTVEARTSLMLWLALGNSSSYWVALPEYSGRCLVLRQLNTPWEAYPLSEKK